VSEPTSVWWCVCVWRLSHACGSTERAADKLRVLRQQLLETAAVAEKSLAEEKLARKAAEAAVAKLKSEVGGHACCH